MTHIPDEAVQAALEQIHAYDYVPDENDFSNMKDAIKSALSYISTPCAVEVKKLDWVATGQTGFLETEFYAVSGSLRHTVHPVEKEDGWFYEHYSIRRDWIDREVWQLTYCVGNNGLSGISGNFKTLEEAKAAAQADFERRILSCVVTKPVDVAAVRKQAFGEGFENGVEQSLNALDAYDDITRNEAEQGIRKLKPDYRALSAEPAQGEQWQEIETAPKDGTEILITNAGYGMLVRIGFWDEARDGIWSVWPGRALMDPTHWMPLPSAPTTESDRTALAQGGTNDG